MTIVGVLGRERRHAASTGVVYWRDGELWLRDGQTHRDDDLPAIIRPGSKEWCREGNLHRENDLPAIICSDGTQFLYVNGLQVFK